MADLCGKPVLQHVIDAARESALYNSRPNLSRSIEVNVCLLIPENDPIRDHFFRKIHIIEGSEKDVLSRYKQCADFFQSDYIVRLTGDCPLLRGSIITKATNVAIIEGYDYFSNVDERVRTFADGYDCEVMSRDLLNYMYMNAKDPGHREHVTTFARGPDLPKNFRFNHMRNEKADQSNLKYSVDTEQDLEFVRAVMQSNLDKEKLSKELTGELSDHRF